MNLTKKIWHDENSEPPKNYLWAKRGKLFKYVNGQWKEVSKKDSEGGDEESSEITLGQAWTRAFKMDKMPIFDSNEYTLTHTDESVPLPDFVLFASEGAVYDISGIDSTKPLEQEDITLPDNLRYYYYLHEINEDSVQDSYNIVPFTDFDESDFVVDNSYSYSGYAYFMYKLDVLSDDFHGSLLSIGRLVTLLNTIPEYHDCVFIIKYKGEYYFTNAYEGD